MASSRDKKTPPEGPGEARGRRTRARGPVAPAPPGAAPPASPAEAAPSEPPGALPEPAEAPSEPPGAPEPAEAAEAAPPGPEEPEEPRAAGLPDAAEEPPEAVIDEPYEVPTPEEAAKEAEPWFDLEPLPPLDQILPEHIAYIRLVVARFSVTPTHWREDLVQEVLLEAHRSRDSRLDVRALLFGITRHVVFRWMAKRNAERTAVALHPPRETVTERSAEDDWQEAQRREAVRAAIDDIPELFREVFVRTELEHKTMPEVARELGIPVNTGYTRLHIARARFLESLQRILARRRIQKKDLSAPVVLGALGALEREIGPARAPDAPDPDTSAEPPPRASKAPSPAGAAPPSAGKPRLSGRPPKGASGAVWFGGGLVAAGAIALGLWLARSPDPGPAGTTAMPDPYTTTAAPDDTPSVTAEPRSPGTPTTSAPDASGTSLRANIPVSPAVLPSSTAAPGDVDPAASAKPAPDLTAEGLEARGVLSLARDGNMNEAVRAAEKFRTNHPTSPYMPQIAKVLAQRSAVEAGADRGSSDDRDAGARDASE